MTTNGLDAACQCTCGRRYCASNRYALAETRRANPEPYEDYALASHRKNWHERQALTSQSAQRHRQPWEGWELDLLEREDLSLVDLARITERTLAAVESAKKKLAQDPRWQRAQDMHLGPQTSSAR